MKNLNFILSFYKIYNQDNQSNHCWLISMKSQRYIFNIINIYNHLFIFNFTNNNYIL